MSGLNFEFFKTSADYILDKIPRQPETALILGSGLGSLADEIEDQIIIEYAEVFQSVFYAFNQCSVSNQIAVAT